jgi:hypothetical protein
MMELTGIGVTMIDISLIQNSIFSTTTADYYGGHFPDNSNANNYGFAIKNRDSVLFVGLCLKPDAVTLSWADSIVTRYSHLSTIVFTHDYLDTNGTLSLAGCRIWKLLISKHSNIPLVMSAHWWGSAQKIDSVDGYLVYQHLYNYQNINGGDGWLRVYIIDYDVNKIDVTTYSPSLNEYKQDECFSLPLITKKRRNA